MFRIPADIAREPLLDRLFDTIDLIREERNEHRPFIYFFDFYARKGNKYFKGEASTISKEDWIDARQKIERELSKEYDYVEAKGWNDFKPTIIDLIRDLTKPINIINIKELEKVPFESSYTGDYSQSSLDEMAKLLK